MNLTQLPSTDPTRLYRYRDGIYAVDLLIAGVVQFDFFTWLSKNPATPEGICKGLGFHERPADVMLTLFKALGLVVAENGIHRVTQLAREHLVAGSQWNLGPYYASLKDRPVCQDLIRALTTGKPANWGSSKSDKEWALAMLEDDFAVQFTAGMDCRGTLLSTALAGACSLAGRKRLLDVAGGSGIYACAFTTHNPHLNATVLDRPPVDQIAAKLIKTRGFSERVDTKACDMFREPWPTGYDVHLLSNVLHDWSADQIKGLLESSFTALEPGGLLIIHDAFIAADKCGPLPVAEYSVILMHSTEGKCYSTAEYETLLEEAEFHVQNYSPTTMDRGFMTATKAA